jgi:hypothetical protein
VLNFMEYEGNESNLRYDFNRIANFERRYNCIDVAVVGMEEGRVILAEDLTEHMIDCMEHSADFFSE